MKTGKFRTLAFYMLSMLLFISCEKEEVYLSQKKYDLVAEELWPFFYHFEEEAASRGVLLDLNNLKIGGAIEELGDPSFVGLCNHGINGINNKVVIDQQFWNRANTAKKESIIFHELGHCVLGRAHDDEQLADGMCKSLMRSGFSSCLTRYNESRSYYLDELFAE